MISVELVKKLEKAGFKWEHGQGNHYVPQLSQLINGIENRKCKQFILYYNTDTTFPKWEISLPAQRFQAGTVEDTVGLALLWILEQEVK